METKYLGSEEEGNVFTMGLLVVAVRQLKILSFLIIYNTLQTKFHVSIVSEYNFKIMIILMNLKFP